jgi:hypothetical protein
MNGKGSAQRPDDGKYRDNWDRIFNSRDHVWVPANQTISWEHCSVCGIVRRADDKNSKNCKGTPKVGPR